MFWGRSFGEYENLQLARNSLILHFWHIFSGNGPKPRGTWQEKSLRPKRWPPRINDLFSPKAFRWVIIFHNGLFHVDRFNFISLEMFDLVFTYFSWNPGLEFLIYTIPFEDSQSLTDRTSFSAVLPSTLADTTRVRSYGLCLPQRHNLRMVDDDTTV